MTSDMAFECLFVSRDSNLFRTLGGTLRDLSISINLCLTSSRAMEMLSQGSTELIVIDWAGEESADLLHSIWKSGNRKKPTIVAVSDSGSCPPGAHLVLRKPVTAEAGAKSFQEAYSRMLVEHRLHARHAVMVPVNAILDDGREVPVTVCDVADGGIGLYTRQDLPVGHLLSFHLQLPSARREIFIQARVLWTRDHRRAGCAFVRVPPVDHMILHEWLKAKIRVKKPRYLH